MVRLGRTSARDALGWRAYRGLMRRWMLAALILAAGVFVGGYALASPSLSPKTSRNARSGWWSYPRLGRPGRGSSAPTSYGVDIQAVYDTAGNPSLVANFASDGGLAKPRWSICSPPNVNICTRAHSASQFLTPGSTPAGTVFEATAIYKGKSYVARTAAWLGTVRATVSPRLAGRPRYGAAVTPHGASWIGGWQADPGYRPPDGGDSGGRGANFDFRSVEACRTRAARRCVNLSAPAERGGFSKRPPVVGAWFTGWYLFAFDQRFAYDTAFGLPGYGSPAVVPVVKAGATVARSVPLGPVIGPRAPQVSILHDAILRDERVLVARVRCSVRCHVWLQVDDNHTGSGARVTLTGSGLVGIPRQQLRDGPLNIQIYVDTGPLVRGKSQLR